MKKIIYLILFLPYILGAQEGPLDIFKALEGSVWSAEGKWGDGSSFKQDVSYEFALNNTIVIAHSMGYTNREQTEFGPRNHGIRQYDETENVIRFWEFDVFGGVTQGIVVSDGRNIIYNYEYGGTALTEIWQYKDDDTYDFTVGIYEDGQWTQKFLETQFKRK